MRRNLFNILFTAAALLFLAASWTYYLLYPSHAQTFSGSYQYINITGQTTTLVRTGNGVMHTVCLNTPVATETVKIYDGISASGTLIGTITVATTQPVCLAYDVAYGAGLTIVTATASSDITVSYR